MPSRRPPGGLPHGRPRAELPQSSRRLGGGPPADVRVVGLCTVDGMALSSPGAACEDGPAVTRSVTTTRRDGRFRVRSDETSRDCSLRSGPPRGGLSGFPCKPRMTDVVNQKLRSAHAPKVDRPIERDARRVVHVLGGRLTLPVACWSHARHGSRRAAQNMA